MAQSHPTGPPKDRPALVHDEEDGRVTFVEPTDDGSEPDAWIIVDADVVVSLPDQQPEEDP